MAKTRRIATEGSALTQYITVGERHHLTIQKLECAPRQYSPDVKDDEMDERFFVVCWYGEPRHIGDDMGYSTLKEARKFAEQWVDRKDAEVNGSRLASEILSEQIAEVR